MPEAFAVLFVFVVAVASYIAAKLMERDPAQRNVRADLVRLQQQRIWLQQRLEQAREESWDPEMHERIAAELAEVDVQLAMVTGELKKAA